MGVFSNASDIIGGLWGVTLIFVLATLSVVLPLHFAPTATFPTSDPRVGYQAGCNGRSTLDIVWSCLSTIFICVYTAVHKNISKRRQGRFKSVLTKGVWVLLGVIVPEFILGLASSEFVKAIFITREIRRWSDPSYQRSAKDSIQPLEDNRGEEGTLLSTHDEPHAQQLSSFASERWTYTHSFFLNMRGFKDQSGGVVKIRHLVWLRRHRQSEYNAVFSQLDDIRRDIDDKNKADPLVKALACVQITWFFVNIIARLASTPRLPVSQLEWTTCAYVVCALGMYILWWNKPYGVSERISLPISSITNDVPPVDIADDTGMGFFVGSLVGSLLFGSFHLAAWNSEFINVSGKPLWRICSLLVTCLPLVPYFIVLIVPTDFYNHTVNIVAIPYCVARLVLFALLALSFWSLPAGVYEVTSWSSFIPIIH